MRTPATLALVGLEIVAMAAVPHVANAGPYAFPWPPGTSMQVTQDCDDSCCDDHVGVDEYAWDFANGTEFPIVAAREGTVSHVKVSSTTGCGSSACANDANYLVIDHGDGTNSVYLHLKGGSLDPAVHCGEFVRRGQHLATADSTGWSTGTHLHYQVNDLRADMSTTCECGDDGMGCAPGSVAWNDFWPNAASPTVPISFDEWPADQCADRHIELPGSTNQDGSEAIVVVDDADAHFSFTVGNASSQAAPSYHGGFSSAETIADGSPSVVGRFAFDGVVTKPAIYEVWGFVPLSSHATAVHAKHVVVARGARAEGTVNQDEIGGGFHPVEGLPPKLKFSGSPGEAVLVENDTGDAGQEIAFDAVLLHEVGPPGSQMKGDPCADATECSGALVCANGLCADGCEVAGCPCGGTCDDTGLCVGGEQNCGAGGASATGSSSATGSGASTGGAGGAPDGSSSGDTSGCSCRMGDGEGTSGGLFAIAVAGVWVRRRKSCSDRKRCI